MARVVLVTRHPAECIELQELVRNANVTILPFPVLRFEPANDDAGWQAVHEHLPDEASCEDAWLVLASPRAAWPFAEMARRRGLGHLLALPVAAVGKGTARMGVDAGLDVRLVGPGTGVDLAAALARHLEAGAPVLLACGHDHRAELPEALAAGGHPVLALEVYRMRPTPPHELPSLPNRVDAVVLTSPRASRLYLDGVGGTPLPCVHWALGATTRDAAAALGIDCRTPQRPDLQSLAEVLCVS